MTVISGHVALAWPANWKTPPRIVRKRDAASVESLRGGVCATTLRASDRLTVDWLVSTRTIAQTQELQAQIRAALEAGQAAAPLWGKAHWATTASAPGANQITVAARPGWTFIVGQWIAFQVASTIAAARGQWAVHQVSGVSTALGLTTLTFASVLTLTCTVGSALYPLLFGRLESPTDAALVTHERADFTLRLVASSGSPFIP